MSVYAGPLHPVVPLLALPLSIAGNGLLPWAHLQRKVFAMYLFTLTATPHADNEEHAGFECADVSAWIDFVEPAGAEELARFYIREAGWTPGDLLNFFELADDAVSEDDETYEFIKEAHEFGHSLLIEAWEEDDSEEEDE